MRIESLKYSQNGDRTRVSAMVIWEDCDRPPFELYYETEGLGSADLRSDPQAYLVACLVPATHYGEKRIHLAEEVCPETLDGLRANMQWFHQWSRGKLKPLQIECARSQADYSRAPGRHAGSFLSGGIDSLATLRKNRLDFPRDHGASIYDCIVVHGFDIGGTTQGGTEEPFFSRALDPLCEIARDADVNLIPIRTNVRLLHDDVGFWMDYFHGAALASVAHILSKRLTRVYIASSHYSSPTPWGSHPLVDPNYGSYALQIRHDEPATTRLAKVRRVAEWDVALRNLRVCTANPDTGVNCGRCEKCLRTMLELLAVGKIESAESFPIRHVDESVLDTLSIHADYQTEWYEELLAPLSELGHHQIVEYIQTKIADYRRYEAWEQEKDWKGLVKRFDRRFLGSGLYRSWKVLRPSVLKMSSRTPDR